MTIIILLILAGISIASLTENNLFEKAKLAKERQNKAEIEENEKLTDYKDKITEYISGNSRGEDIKLGNCTITISDSGYLSVNDIVDLESFFIIRDNKYLDVTKSSTYFLWHHIGEKHDYYVIAIDKNANLYKSNIISCTLSYSETGETADELVERLGTEAGAGSSIAGKEITYIKYKDKDGNEKDKWVIAYIGKNKDTASDVADDMPTNENHIYLLPKYPIAYISPANSTITISNANQSIETEINTTSGYPSTPAFKDAMRNSSIWNAYSKGAGSSTHGAMSIVQYNMCVEWAGSYKAVSFGSGYWLDDPTWSNAIARVDSNGSRSGNGLSYWTDVLSIRPLVMLGTNCKLINEDRIIY